MPAYIHAPLINVNDDEMTLIEWTKPAGTRVARGEVVAVIETTKSTADLEAEAAGFLTPLVEPGSLIRVGQVIGALTEQPGEPVSLPEGKGGAEVGLPPRLDRRRWTKKAEIIAARHGLDPAALEIAPADGQTVSEADVLGYLAARGVTPPGEGSVPKPAGTDLTGSRLPHGGLERVLVIGGGGAGLQILDVLTRVPHQVAAGVLDDDAALHGKTLLGAPVLGGIGEAARLLAQGVFDAAIISIGTRTELRAAIFERLRGAGVPFTNVIDPRAAILSGAALGAGNAVMPFVQVAAATRVGDNNFFSAFVDIEHHNVVGSHCTFGPGVMTSGGVQIGSRVKFGAGVFVEPLLRIGDDCTVASGVALTRSVPGNSIVKAKANFVVRPREERR
jgi:sugar O-acyltransferase (sialic acid O-acetyltransferase NeuD family)